MIANPTVVLVHGAFADASGFAGIIRELQSQGLEVRAPMNPLRGLGFDADAIARYTTSIDGPILLAGHSYGGAVISQAATAIKTAAALVYLSAFRPRRERELCQSAGAIPSFVAGIDVDSQPVRRARSRRRTGPIHQDRGLPADLLRRPP